MECSPSKPRSRLQTNTAPGMPKRSELNWPVQQQSWPTPQNGMCRRQQHPVPVISTQLLQPVAVILHTVKRLASITAGWTAGQTCLPGCQLPATLCAAADCQRRQLLLSVSAAANSSCAQHNGISSAGAPSLLVRRNRVAYAAAPHAMLTGEPSLLVFLLLVLLFVGAGGWADNQHGTLSGMLLGCADVGSLVPVNACCTD